MKGLQLRICVKDFVGTNSTTREDGHKIYKYLNDHWLEFESIDIDFNRLQVASVSFFDEAFGMLAKEYSKKEIEKKIHFYNMNENDQDLFNSIIQSRHKYFRKSSAKTHAKSSSTIKAGDEVIHPEFGQGVVIAVLLSVKLKRKIYKIAFKEHGFKTIDSAFFGLEKINAQLLG